MVKTVFVLLGLFTGMLAGAQVSIRQGPYAGGRVLDDSNGRRIAYVEIYNESRRKGYLTDSTGKFRIPASLGDTLVVTTFGYLGKVVIIDASFYQPGRVIRLSPQAYEIGEVDIVPFTDYNDFKKQFLALQLPHTKTDILRENLASMAHRVGSEAAETKAANDAFARKSTEIVSVSVPIYSRYERQMQNYKEVLKKEERQRVIDKKYNRDIIFKVTRLSEDEITEFMGFCNFSEEFLYKATPYEILVSIEEKFKKYKLMKESSKLEMLQEKLIDELLG
jgi:hypothetical protein